MESGAVIFNDDQTFILGQINGEICGIFKPEHDDKIEKYSTAIRLMSIFENLFDKRVTCWEHMVTYNDREIYAVRIDFNEIYDKVESMDDFIIISIDDIANGMEGMIEPEMRWLVYMALDKKMRGKLINEKEQK